MCGADTTALPTEDFKKFIEKICEKFDFMPHQIVFGNEMLEKDTWNIDILENTEYADRLRKAYDKLKLIPETEHKSLTKEEEAKDWEEFKAEVKVYAKEGLTENNILQIFSDRNE
jgi:hypothetical protein